MPHFQKGSKEAKEYMRVLRERRGKSKGGMINPFYKMEKYPTRTMDYNPEKHFSDDHQMIYHNADGSKKQPFIMPSGRKPLGLPKPTGNGLATGLATGMGVVEIHHHHHHHHMGGEGMFDWLDPNRNGVAKAFDPRQNGVSNAVNSTFTPALGNQILGGLKTAGHYGIPIFTGALGSTAGELLSGGNPLAGFAGNQAGKYAGQQLVNKIGIGLKTRGRPKKH